MGNPWVSINQESTLKLKQLGIDMSHIRTKFLDSTGNPWVPINPSLHSMCAHSWQLFQICSTPIGTSLLLYSRLEVVLD